MISHPLSMRVHSRDIEERAHRVHVIAANEKQWRFRCTSLLPELFKHGIDRCNSITVFNQFFWKVRSVFLSSPVCHSSNRHIPSRVLMSMFSVMRVNRQCQLSHLSIVCPNICRRRSCCHAKVQYESVHLADCRFFPLSLFLVWPSRYVSSLMLLFMYWRTPFKCVALERRRSTVAIHSHWPLTIEKFRFNSFLSIVANEPFTRGVRVCE